MVHDRELAPGETLPADPRQGDERWPVPCAVMFISAVTVALWSLIMAAANWLIG